MALRYISRDIRLLALTVQNSLRSLNTSFDPYVTLAKFKAHKWTNGEIFLAVSNALLAGFWLTIMPSNPIKLLIPIAYGIALLLPVTSQFILPASPVLAWLLTYFSSRALPASYRPPISVSVLPTLESVLYGANISDILTRFTHPVLDIIAWLPYGVIHFTFPFVVAIFLWLFRQKAALRYWAFAFGYMNLIGVICQILLPCAPPWYEIIYGSTPADYSMLGSPGGLARIDRLLNTHAYTGAFSTSPVIFGAFPSLHAGCSTIEALFISHFFPQHAKKAWTYVLVLYWATMYLTHHYLIDVVGGACLAVMFFFLTMPPAVKGSAATQRSAAFIAARQVMGLSGGSRTAKYEQYDLERRANHSGNRGTSADSNSSRDSMNAAPLPLSAIRSPNPEPGAGAIASFQAQQQKSHKHTASIASLIHASDRVEEGWSPVVSDFASAADRIRGAGHGR
ncbi:Aureobasidin resistance protein Aur1 [Tulasnella sp. 403]|nr:Aureobasidin resistance protein Aur1 [Tulasnella sp. 403]